MTTTYYDTLEVSDNVDSSEIKKAYRRLSLKYHPDKNKNNPESVTFFHKITEAFEVLGDDDKRREYDMKLKNPFFGMGGFGGGGMSSYPQHSPDILFQNIDEMFLKLFFGNGGGMGGGGMGGRGMGDMGVDMMPGIRIFRTKTGGGGGGNMGYSPQLQKPTPIVKNVKITMAHVLTGASIPVEIERWIIENGNKIFETQTIYVPIAKGIDDNEIIVLSGEGNANGEYCKGDIKLFVKIDNSANPDFTRVGLDLIYCRTISLKDALCGFSFELKYVNGKTYTINNTQNCSIIPPDYVKTIPNMGLSRDGHTGNLIIRFTVVFPTTLTREQIQKLGEIL